MGLKSNGIWADGVTLMGRATRASWNQYDVIGRGIGNRIMFGMYVSRPVGYYEKATFLPFSYGGAAVRLAGISSTTNTIEALGSLETSTAINGIGIPVFNGNEGWHIFANLDGEGIVDTANMDDSRGALEAIFEIGSKPSAYDITQAVLNAMATTYNNAGTIGEKINAAGAAGDPWMTPLPGGYFPGTAGDIIGNQIPDIKTLAEFLSNIEGGRWRLVGNQMIFYKSDNVTEVARFNLYNAAGAPSMTEVYERSRA
jgi:hypothetical protein